MIGDKAIPGADPRKHEAGAEKRAVPNRSSPLAASWAEPSIPLFPMVPLLQRAQAERGGGFMPVGGRKATRKQQATVSDWRWCPEPSFDGPAYCNTFNRSIRPLGQ